MQVIFEYEFWDVTDGHHMDLKGHQPKLGGALGEGL
jgi:hypothetical protein